VTKTLARTHLGWVLQGLGGAIVLPLSLTILTTAFPAERRGMIVGIYGGLAGFALLAALSALAITPPKERPAPQATLPGSPARREDIPRVA